MHDLLSADKWLKVWTYRETFLNGLLNTVETAVVALLLSFAIGVVIGLMSTSGKKALRAIARVYVEIIQNTPLLLQVLFLYYALAFSGHSLGVIRTGMIGLGIYHGAYMAEVIRAGITAIPAGQFDAAHSQGFGYVGLMYHIIIPQTIKIILPPMVNQVVALIKNTSCLYIIGGADLISATYSFVTGAQTGGAYAPAYLVSGIIFFVVCFPLSRLAGRWEANLKLRESVTAQPNAQREITDAELDAIIREGHLDESDGEGTVDAP